MRKRRYTGEQIIKVLSEQESGSKAQELCLKFGISEQSFYRWRSKYGGMRVSEARWLKALEEEKERLKQIVGEHALDIRALKAALEKSTKPYSAEGTRDRNEVRGEERASIMQFDGTG